MIPRTVRSVAAGQALQRLLPRRPRPLPPFADPSAVASCSPPLDSPGMSRRQASTNDSSVSPPRSGVAVLRVRETRTGNWEHRTMYFPIVNTFIDLLAEEVEVC